MFEIFKKKKLIAIHYINVLGLSKEKAKEKIDEYAETYAQFRDDPKIKEIFIPTTGESRLDFVKL